MLCWYYFGRVEQAAPVVPKLPAARDDGRRWRLGRYKDAARQRRHGQLDRLIERLEGGDTLMVTKMDRLARSVTRKSSSG